MKRVLLLFALPVAWLLAADNALPRSVLWRQPQAPSVQDWVCGPGGCGLTPVPPFRYKAGDESGSNPKINVIDARGRHWNVKFGAEVIPECFGSRFLNAIGYVVEPSFFVAAGKLESLPEIYGEARRIVKNDGTFTKARFQARGLKDFEFVKGQSWSWNENPFQGTRELAGLKIVMMLLSNWDAKDARDGDESNNAVFRNPGGEWLYSMYDWGASLGHWGGVFRRDQSDCSAYQSDTPHFVKGLNGSIVEFGFSGKHGADLSTGISVEDVRWLLRSLAGVSPDRLRAALKASGATERQNACWAGAIQDRIRQLQAVAR